MRFETTKEVTRSYLSKEHIGLEVVPDPSDTQPSWPPPLYATQHNFTRFKPASLNNPLVIVLSISSLFRPVLTCTFFLSFPFFRSYFYYFIITIIFYTNSPSINGVYFNLVFAFFVLP